MELEIDEHIENIKTKGFTILENVVDKNECNVISQKLDELEKLQEDEFLAEKFSNYNVDIIGLRYFNVYGKGQTGTYAGVITKFLNRLKGKKSPEIYGDGSQVRDFVYVEDVAEANLSAMKSNTKNGFFNIGTGKITSIKELAHIMIEIFDENIQPRFLDPLKGDVKKSQADTEYTKSEINWEYKVELKDGLSKFRK